MKKTTLFLLFILSIGFANAQFTVTTIVDENFESSTATSSPYANGFPSSFLCLSQQAWNTASATKNVNPYTGTLWKDCFSDNTTAANKTYSNQSFAEEGAGVSGGTQCLLVTLPDLPFDNGT